MLENQNPVSAELSFEECRDLHSGLIQASMLLPLNAPHPAIADSEEYAAFEAKAKAAYLDAVNVAVRNLGLARVRPSLRETLDRFAGPWRD